MAAKFGSLEKGIKRLASIEMKFFRRTSRYAFFDHKRNEEILEECKVQPADEKLKKGKKIKQSRYRPGVAQRVPGSQGSQLT
jgi:hypothetical protein